MFVPVPQLVLDPAIGSEPYECHHDGDDGVTEDFDVGFHSARIPHSRRGLSAHPPSCYFLEEPMEHRFVERIDGAIFFEVQRPYQIAACRGIRHVSRFARTEHQSHG